MEQCKKVCLSRGDEREAPFYVILDTRDRERFLEAHLLSSAHIPRALVEDRLYELPPPKGDPAEEDVNLCVVYDEGMEETEALLKEKGYVVVKRVEGKTLRDCDPQLLERGKTGFVLWKPNPCLQKVWPVIVEGVRHKQKKLCLDLAAGNGRDAIFVAKGGFHVLAIDYQKRQWSKIDDIAKRTLEELPEDILAGYGSVRSNDMNLEAGDPTDKILALLERPADLVIVSRYLHRPLFAVLHKLVSPGGFLLFHQFMVGAESVGRKTPTKARFLLQKDELRKVFSEQFDVIEDSVIHLPDGRPTSCFLAQRKK